MRNKLDDIEELALNSAFDENGTNDDGSEGFEALSNTNLRTVDTDSTDSLKRGGNELNKTNTIPFTLYTDKVTATQLTVLLGMIRFCMEKSAEGLSGDNREFSINVKIRNRAKSDFLFSIGDESISAIPNEPDIYIGN